MLENRRLLRRSTLWLTASRQAISRASTDAPAAGSGTGRRRRRSASATGAWKRIAGTVKSARGEQVAQRLGMQRLDVGEVAQVGLEEGEPAGRVYGLYRDGGAGPQLAPRHADQPDERIRRKVLHDLSGEQPAERAVRQRLQKRECIAGCRGQPPVAARRDHLRVGVDAACRDPRLAQQVEKLSSPTADVEHVGRSFEERHVVALALADGFPRAPIAVLEADVGVSVDGGVDTVLTGGRHGSGGGRGRRIRGGRCGGRRPRAGAADGEHLVLQVGYRGIEPVQCLLAAVECLGLFRHVFRDPPRQPRRLPVLGVDVRCDLLQVLDEP